MQIKTGKRPKHLQVTFHQGHTQDTVTMSSNQRACYLSTTMNSASSEKVSSDETHTLNYFSWRSRVKDIENKFYNKTKDHR